MASRQIPITATGQVRLGTGPEMYAATIAVHIFTTGAPTFALKLRGRVTPPRRELAEVAMTNAPLDGTAPALTYTKSDATAATGGATDITAAGLYYVRADHLDVIADVSALALGGGTVTIAVAGVIG